MKRGYFQFTLDAALSPSPSKASSVSVVGSPEKKISKDLSRPKFYEPNLPLTILSTTIAEEVDEIDCKKVLPSADAFSRTDFNDPIHGNITIHPLCLKIIDTPQFKRLENLKQLGVTFHVFRSAQHTRFSHSIGVAFLAEKVVKILADKQPYLNITPADLLCVTVAGLCHDLGHGPFSHVFDNVFMNHRIRERQERLGRPFKEWRHEDASVEMLRYILSDNNLNLSEYGLSAVDLTFIEEIIRGTKEKDRIGRPREKFYLYDIVNNNRSGLDVDKIDYFLRDIRHTNVLGCLPITFNRFIEFGRVLRAEPIRFSSSPCPCPCPSPSVVSSGADSPFPSSPALPSDFRALSKQISLTSTNNTSSINVSQKEREEEKTSYDYMVCYPQKLASEAGEFFSTRFRMHQLVYSHKTTRKIEHMICDVLLEADPYILIEGSVTDRHPTGHYRISESAFDAQALSQLDDSILKVIRLSNEPGLARAKHILNRIDRRDLYSYVGKTIYSRESKEIDRLSEADIRKAIVQSAITTSQTDSQPLALTLTSCNLDETLDEIDVTVSSSQGLSQDQSLPFHSDGGPIEVTQDAFAFSSVRESVSPLNEEDIIVEKIHIHFGSKDKNPVDNLRFFEKTADPRTAVARAIGEGACEGLKPRSFEELVLRVYCRDSAKLPAAREAFARWCKSVKCAPGPPLTFLEN